MSTSLNQYALEADEGPKKAIADAYVAFLAHQREKKIITEEEERKRKETMGKNIFCFSSEAEAREFFTEQARKGVAFLSFEVDADGKLTDGPYFFSDGNGQFYEGKLIPETAQALRNSWKGIQGDPAIKAQVYDALKKNDASAINQILEQIQNPTVGMKGRLSNVRQSTLTPPSGTGTPNASQSQTPFSTTPIPPGAVK